MFAQSVGNAQLLQRPPPFFKQGCQPAYILQAGKTTCGTRVARSIKMIPAIANGILVLVTMVFQVRPRMFAQSVGNAQLLQRPPPFFKQGCQPAYILQAGKTTCGT